MINHWLQIKEKINVTQRETDVLALSFVIFLGSFFAGNSIKFPPPNEHFLDDS